MGRIGGPNPADPVATRIFRISGTLNSRRRGLLSNVGQVEFDVYLSLGACGYSTFSEYHAVVVNDIGAATGTVGSAVRSQISTGWSVTCICAMSVLAVT